MLTQVMTRASRNALEGDRVVAVSASFGSGMWKPSTIEGIVSAVSSRLFFNSPVRLQLERKVGVGKWSGGYDHGRIVDLASLVNNDREEPANSAKMRRASREARQEARTPSALKDVLGSLEELRLMNASTASTRAVLIERCGALVLRYCSLVQPLRDVIYQDQPPPPL
jgi:hypothetical protein